MASIFLAPYTVRLRDGSGELLKLSEFKKDQDFLECARQYFRARSTNPSHDVEARRLLRVTKRARSGRRLSGTVETGEYGYETTLMDAESEAVSYQRTANDADMRPFHFSLFVPTGADEGIIVLQRTGNLGIRKLLVEDWAGFFRSEHPDVSIEFNPLVPQALIDNYLNDGRLTKVRFVAFDIPSDITDAYDAGGHVERAGYAEFVVTARRNGSLPLLGPLRRVLNGERDMHQMIELTGLGFNYDRVKVELDFQGHRRTVDLSDLRKLRPNVDVTDEVVLGDNGHPTFESINGSARALILDLASAMGIASDA